MADFDTDSYQPRTARPRTQAQPYQPPAVQQPQAQPSGGGSPYQTQPQQGSQNGGYTPPPNAGSWNPYYRQEGTTQPQGGGYNPYGGYQTPGQGGNSGGYGGYYPPQGGYSYPPQGYQQGGYSYPPQGGAQYQPFTMGADFRYTMPGGANTQLGQYGGALEGFDTGKLNDPARTSAKYMFGRLASKYEPTQQGFGQLMADPEFKQLGMQSLGNGKIRLSNGDVIDVVRGFQSGGKAWQWGAETVNGQAPEAAAGPQAPPAQQAWMDQYSYPGGGPGADPYGVGAYMGYGTQGGYPQGGYGYTPGGQPVMNPYDFYAQMMPGQGQIQQVWEQPSTPEPYGQAPPQTGYYVPPGAIPYEGGAGGYQQDYPSYNQGYSALAGGGYNQGYGALPQAFQHLAQGMVPGGGYGGTPWDSFYF